MKKFVITAFSALALIGGGVMLNTWIAVPDAQAQSGAKAVVDGAIAKGRIGETISGYLAAVGSVTDAERRAMNEINIGRKSAYTQLAEKQGVSTEVVARVIGEKQLAKAAPGTKVMGADGRWRSK